jgi:hypothetical protein
MAMTNSPRRIDVIGTDKGPGQWPDHAAIDLALIFVNAMPRQPCNLYFGTT